MTIADFVFLIGAGLEAAALQWGVSTKAVAWSLIVYGIVLLGTGYRE